MTDSSDLQDEVGLVGQQILLALNAFKHPEQRFECHVRHETFLGDDLLTKGSSRRFLTYDSLPGILQVKAIGVDKRTLFVELTPFDKEVLLEQTWPADFRIGMDGIWKGRRKLAHVSRGGTKVEQEHGARSLWMIDLDKATEAEVTLAIRALDYADQEHLYAHEGAREQVMVNPPAASAAPRLEMRMSLQLDLIQEQVPVMAQTMRIEGNMGMHMQQNLELVQMQRFERWLGRNPVDAIQQALDKDSSPAGQARIAKLIAFKMARDVKNAAAQVGMNLDWKGARKIVRRIMAQSHAA